MFGVLGYFLALGVALSHAGFLSKYLSFSVGVFCVIIFFLLAGYTMTFLWSTRYIFSTNISNYFFERLTRIYPQYLFFLILTMILIYLGIIKTDLVVPNNLIYHLYNLSIIPLDFYMWDDNLKNYIILPATWSLGLEMMFYLFFPFILFNNMIFKISFIGSLAIFLLAFTEILNTEIWGYRFLPGVLFIFLTGSLIFKYINKKTLFNTLLLFGVYIFVTILFITMLIFNFDQGYMIEVTSGFIVGVPLVYFLSLQNRRNKIDEFLGNLSYGIFLSHFIFIWAYQTLPFGLPSYIYFPLFIIIVSIVGFIGYKFIERPFRNISVIKKIAMR